MSKTKSLRITALAAIVSLLLAFASLATFMTARANGTQQIDTSKITVTTEDMGIASGAMVIDFGLNSQSADAGIAQTEQATVAAKVILTRNGTETSFSRFLLGKGKIGIDLNEGFTDGTKPAAIQEGDTLTLKSGLAVYNVTAGGMNNWFATDPVTLATLAEDVTLTYTDGAWFLPGQGPKTITAADVTVAGQKGQFGISGNNVIIDFGLNSSSQDAGIAQNTEQTKLQEQILLKRDGVEKAFSRYYLGQGKIAMDFGEAFVGGGAPGDLTRGDVLLLKEGLTVYNVTAGGMNNWFATSPVAVGKLSEDVTLVYNGTEWQAPVNATSVTIANKEAIQKITVGAKVQMQVTVDENALETQPPVYSVVSGAEYASVDQKGVITGIAEGQATVKVQYAEVSDEVTFTVSPKPAVTGVIVNVGNYQTTTDGKGGQPGDGVVVKNGKAYLRAYIGEPLEPSITANANVRNVKYSLAYGAGIEGSTQTNLKKAYLAETGANFTFVKNADAGTVNASWGKYTFTATGAQSIPVTVTVPEGETNAGETVTGELPVWVYDAPKAIEPLAAAQLDAWGNHFVMPFYAAIEGEEDIVPTFYPYKRSALQYGFLDNAIVLHGGNSQGDAALAIHEIGHLSHKRFAVLFENAQGGTVSVNDFADVLTVGSVLEFTENFRFYYPADGDVVALYKLTAPAKYVWTGKSWADFTSDATDFTVADTLTVPQYAKFALDITLTPPDAYLAVTYTSDNSEIVEVLQDGMLYAKSAGKATITVTAVAGESKTVAVTVSEGSQRSIAIANDRTFRVQKGGTLDLSKIRVKVCYGTGSNGKAYYGEEIALTAEDVTAELKSGDFSKAGKGTATISVTLTDHGTPVTGDISVTVEVPEIFEIYPDNLTCADDKHIFKNTIVIYFNKTFVNQANVYLDKLTPEQKQSIIDHIEYSFVRGDSNVKLEVQGYLQQMLFVVPYTGDSADTVANQIGSYVNGDRITLKAGLEFYAWFGDRDKSNVPVGEGEYIKVGELKYDAVFTYNAGKWSWQIEPADGVVLQEKVTVGIGEQHRANVEIVPSYATNGEWYYTVADSSVATIDTKGLITGKKIGSTGVTAVLKDRLENTIKTVTFDIEVTDSVKSLQITASKKVTVKTGTDLDVAKLVSDFGIKGNVVMASGAIGKEVDLTKAKITGYKADENGKQTITFRLTVDGKSVTGTLDITVGKSSKKKCGGAVSAANVLFAGGGLLAVTVLLCLRKRKQNA